MRLLAKVQLELSPSFIDTSKDIFFPKQASSEDLKTDEQISSLERDLHTLPMEDAHNPESSTVRTTLVPSRAPIGKSWRNKNSPSQQSMQAYWSKRGHARGDVLITGKAFAATILGHDRKEDSPCLAPPTPHVNPNSFCISTQLNFLTTYKRHPFGLPCPSSPPATLLDDPQKLTDLMVSASISAHCNLHETTRETSQRREKCGYARGLGDGSESPPRTVRNLLQTTVTLFSPFNF